jgi:hypothetical protein
MPLGNNTSSETTTTQIPPVETVEETVAEEVVNTNLPDVTLIVEDGSGLPNANSYCDLDYALEYCTMKGYTSWQSLSETEQKVFIIRGTEFVDNFYNWRGRKGKGSQALSFPRFDLYDDDHYLINGIPEKLKKACLEAAFLNSSTDASTLFSTKDENGAIKRQKVDSLEVEYFNNQQNETNLNAVDYTTIYDILNKLLKGLYKEKEENGSVCTRAIWRG